MRSIRLLGASILTAAGLITVGATSETAHAAGSLDLHVTYTSVIKLETIRGTGQLPVGGTRPVQLQYRNTSSGPWTVLKTSSTAPEGDFSFTFNTGKTRYFRYYAPASGGQPSIKGNSRKLTVVSQKVQYFAVSTYCATNGHNLVTLTADFYPSRPERPVTFSTTQGDKFDDQDSNGIATAVIDVGSAGFTGQSAIATAEPLNNAPAITTKEFTHSAPGCSLP